MTIGQLSLPLTVSELGKTSTYKAVSSNRFGGTQGRASESAAVLFFGITKLHPYSRFYIITFASK